MAKLNKSPSPMLSWAMEKRKRKRFLIKSRHKPYLGPYIMGYFHFDPEILTHFHFDLCRHLINRIK